MPAAVGFLAPLIGLNSAFAVVGFVSQISGLLLTTALTTVVVSALTPRPKLPSIDNSYRLTAKVVAGDRQTVYGRTRTGGILVYEGVSGGGAALNRIIVLTGHQVESIDEIWIGDKRVTKFSIDNPYPAPVRNNASLARGWVSEVEDIEGNVGSLTDAFSRNNDGEIIHYAYIETFNGLQNQVIPGGSKLLTIPDWSTDHRLRGCAFIFARFQFNPTAFKGGVPEVSVVLKGKRVYDPRTGNTSYSNNPALCIRDYISTSTGLDEDDVNIDDDRFSSEADICDTEGYTCDGAFTTGTVPADILTDLLTSCAGTVWYGQGKWRLKVASWREPVYSLGDDDFLSPLSVATRNSRRDNFNIITGRYISQETNWQATQYPEVTAYEATGTAFSVSSVSVGDYYIIETVGNTDWATLTGVSGTYSVGDIVRVLDITAATGTGEVKDTLRTFVAEDNNIESKLQLDLPFTNSREKANKLAAITLKRNRKQIAVEVTVGMEGFKVQVGDNIYLSHERFSWVDKEFEVVGWSFIPGGQNTFQIRLTLSETEEDAFESDLIFQPGTTASGSNDDSDLNLVVSNLVVGVENSNLFLAWDINDTDLLGYYSVGYRLVGATTYNLITVPSTAIETTLPGLAAGDYEVIVTPFSNTNEPGTADTNTATIS